MFQSITKCVFEDLDRHGLSHSELRGTEQREYLSFEK